MKRLFYIIALVLLLASCGEEVPADDTAADTSTETSETAEATEDVQEDNVEITPPDMVTARHILICYDGCAVNETFNRTQDEALEMIQELHGRIQNEELSFAQAAIEYSDCPSGQDGGMLGQFGRGAMVPAFEEAAFTLPVGGMSDVVETQFGYHLILREQ